MTHDPNDPMCQFVEMTERDYEANNGFYAPPDCQCALIAKVREQTLAAAAQRVEVLCISPHEWDYTPRKSLGEIKHEAWQEAIAAIKGDQP